MKTIRDLDLDFILHGGDKEQPTWDDICLYFKEGEFYEEHYLIEAIEKYLMTEKQAQLLYEYGLNISKILNGKYGQDQQEIVYSIYKEWNDKLDFKKFGY